MKGKGASVPLSAPLSSITYFDQDTEVIVQLHASTPDSCWTSTFSRLSTKQSRIYTSTSTHPAPRRSLSLRVCRTGLSRGAFTFSTLPDRENRGRQVFK